MSHDIVSVAAREILDSRGWPTLEVTVTLEDGSAGVASVPAGASTGRREACDKRDGDAARFAGRGVQKARACAEYELSTVVTGRDATRQTDIDRAMIRHDATSDRSKMGANAILGISLATARAAAASLRTPLYAYLGGVGARRLPVPLMNVLNGGRHASNRLAMQEFMIVPHGAPTFSEALRWGVETYHAVGDILADRGLSTAVGDEGGFAPDLGSEREALEVLVQAIGRAGYTAGDQIAIALDPAASSFVGTDGHYDLPGVSHEPMTSDALLETYVDWTREFPIVSIEDGFAEDDWSGFQRQTVRQGGEMQIVGDDLFTTRTDIIAKGIAEGCGNAVLIKPNQVGTLTETMEAVERCRQAGWRYIISHRAGETDDTFIADLAVAMGGGQIKAGAPARGERVAKYNRLLAIEADLRKEAEFYSPFAR